MLKRVQGWFRRFGGWLKAALAGRGDAAPVADAVPDPDSSVAGTPSPLAVPSAVATERQPIPSPKDVAPHATEVLAEPVGNSLSRQAPGVATPAPTPSLADEPREGVAYVASTPPAQTQGAPAPDPLEREATPLPPPVPMPTRGETEPALLGAVAATPQEAAWSYCEACGHLG